MCPKWIDSSQPQRIVLLCRSTCHHCTDPNEEKWRGVLEKSESKRDRNRTKNKRAQKTYLYLPGASISMASFGRLPVGRFTIFSRSRCLNGRKEKKVRLKEGNIRDRCTRQRKKDEDNNTQQQQVRLPMCCQPTTTQQTRQYVKLVSMLGYWWSWSCCCIIILFRHIQPIPFFVSSLFVLLLLLTHLIFFLLPPRS